MKAHTFRPDDFKDELIGLCDKEVLERISISKASFAYRLTEKGERIARITFDSSFKDFREVFFKYSPL